MFSRIPHRLHICLRCRIEGNAFPRYHLLSTVEKSQIRSSQRRRQGTSAVAVEEEHREEYYNTSTHDAVHAGETQHEEHNAFDASLNKPEDAHSTTSNSTHELGYVEESSGTGIRPTSNTRYRHWRPSPTASLGVNVLGKPGEILVLPEPRKKRHRPAKSEDDGDENENENENADDKGHATRTPKIPSNDATQREGIYESLKKEQKPVSGQELIKSINSVKAEFQDGDTWSTQPAAWQRCRRKLSKSFTRSQLQVYIDEVQSQDTKKQNGSVGLKTGRELAGFVLESIWKFTPETQVAAPAAWTLKLKPAIRDLIVTASKLDVQSAKSIQVAPFGFTGVGDDAHENLKTLAADCVSRKILKPFVLRKPLSRLAPEHRSRVEAFAHSEVKRIAQKLQITLDPSIKSDYYRAYQFSASTLTKFERGLTLADHAVQRFVESLQPPIQCSQPTYYVPYQSGEEASLESWYRPQSSVSVDQEAYQKAASQVIPELTKALNGLPSCFEIGENLLIDERLRPGLITSYMAEYGALSMNTHDSSQSSVYETRFGPRTPYLAQFLNQLQADPVRNQASTELNRIPAETSLCRMLFRPRGSPRLPSIEIYADVSNTFNINIHAIYLQFPNMSRLMSHPTSLTDLQMHRQQRLPIFRRGQHLDEHLVPLVGAIAQQLPFLDSNKSTRRSISNSISPLIDLNLACLTPTQETQILVKYAFEQSQKLNITTYRLSAADPFYLEHVLSCNPAFPPNERQSYFHTLRLVDRSSLSYLPESLQHSFKRSSDAEDRGSNPTDSSLTPAANSSASIPPAVNQKAGIFKQFISSAFNVAYSIDRFGRERSQQLASRYPSLGKFD